MRGTKSVIIRRIRKRLLEENKNALILIVGDTGSGKSLDAIRMGLEISGERFTPAHVAHQKGIEFMRVINTPGLRRGDTILWDDVGKGLKKRDWYEMVNKAVIDVLQVFRVLGLCVIFTCPDAKLIDSNALALFHYWGEMVKIDRKNQTATMKFFEIQHNRRSGKMYWHYLRERVGGKIKTITRFTLLRPPKEFERQYEKDKRPAVKRTLTETTKLFEKMDAKQKLEMLNDAEIVEEILQDAESFLKTYNKRTTVDRFAIMARFKVGMYRANKIKGMAERLLTNDTHTP